MEAAQTAPPAELGGDVAVPTKEAPKGAHPNNKKVKVNKRTKLPSAAAPWNPKYRKPEPSLADRTLETIRQMGTTPEGVAELLNWVQREKCRCSFAEFFRQAWKVIEPSTDLVWNWHLQVMCNVAQAIVADWLRTKKDPNYVNKCRNVLINVPPGSSKSKVFSVCLQAWIWLHWPGAKFIALSVNDDAAMRDARGMRDLVKSEWYVGFNTGFEAKVDQDAVSNFGNTSGGERLSMASRSKVVGLRADLLSIDDANSPDETQKERAEVNELWDTTQANRLNDLARSLRFGIQQRTGAGDWSEHVIERQGAWSPDNLDGWLHVVLPAEFESSRKFILPEPLVELLKQGLPEEEWIFADPRTQEGETIDKRRMPPNVLAAERRRWEGTGNYAAQMQQRPALIEGARVKRDFWGWFRLERGVRADVDELETGRPRPAHCHVGEAQVVRTKTLAVEEWDFDWIVISMDCAAKKTERGSNWGILVVAGKDGRRYVLDDRTRRGDILEIIEVLRELIRLWHPDKVLIEDKAAGTDLELRLLAEMQKGDMPMIWLEKVKPNAGGGGREQGKEARLDACISVIANGFVYLLDGAPWLEDFVEELAVFPHGRHDDRVDSLTQVLNHFKDFDEDQWPSL